MISVRVFIALLSLVSSLEAIEVEFDASVDRTRVAQSEALLLTLRIVSDENLQHMPAPTLSLGDFHVEGPSVSSRIEMVNFTTSYERELTYRLYAKKQGRIRIGSAQIEIDGKTYRTRPIDIEVVRAGQRSGRNLGGDFNVEDHLYVRARSDLQRAYVGQQITVDFDLQDSKQY